LREVEEVGSQIAALVSRVARRHGLTHAALNALAVIEGAGGPIPTGELSARMHVTTGTMTSVLDTLERNGHILRLADPDDRRRVLVELTPHAQAVLDRVLPAVQQAVTAAAGGLSEATLNRLLADMATLRVRLAAVPDELPPPPPRRTPPRLRRSA
jgi:DNA-binding MarR family transcriptional regulator